MKHKMDPLTRAAMKTYRSTPVGQLAALINDERRWVRKETIARNKLRLARAKLNAFAMELAHEKVKAPTT